MSEIYRCLACQSTTATPAPNRMEDWHWKQLDASGRHAGPFCTETCADGWMLWPEEARLASIFGDATRATVTLQRFDDGRFVQDTPAIGDPLWRLDFGTVLHPNTIPSDKTGLPQGKCPNPTARSSSFLINPDCCDDCSFKQPAGWRQVAAR